MKPNLPADFAKPNWLPDAVKLYVDHTAEGLSIRELARREGTHASTVMRAVRRCELRREDPLIDEALAGLVGKSGSSTAREEAVMTISLRTENLPVDESILLSEGSRILRRLAEPGAVLALAGDMEKAVVLREFPDGKTARTGVVDRAIAQAFAIQSWIYCRKQGRIAAYEITAAGRAALKRMMDDTEKTPDRVEGFAEAATPFGNQHREWEERTIIEGGAQRRVRYNLAESPIAVMGRRRDKDGKLFLDPELVRAGERLREDFEVAQMGPRVAQNWERFLTGADRGAFRPDSGRGEGPADARERVAAALRDLGPGLGDVALRVCCFMEGIETTEKRMGWAARSGKIVLRIALQRLKRHYDETYGPGGRLIG
ncbi:DUF6456 domain-containing protein [Thioclava sp. FR2]|uniref:DUF6456 domain-containing protein n=1 Tax=Thioclava sp. FR2 TaxID=3445780 RepID=UPI003EBCA359